MGARGEGWVIGQFVLLLAVALAPTTPLSLPAWLRWPGYLGMAAGVLVGLAGARSLGESLTALPAPREEARFVDQGLYAWVRHPLYLSLILAGTGWALFRGSGIGLLLTGLLFVLLDAKSRREEAWLVDRYPEYEGYRRRVRRLIPFLY